MVLKRELNLSIHTSCEQRENASLAGKLKSPTVNQNETKQQVSANGSPSFRIKGILYSPADTAFEPTVAP